MGTRRFTVDPRRRFGRHGDARRMLAADEENGNGHGSGAWGGLVSALQRHTVHSELARLPKDDRQILSLAYVHGHTNREIAVMLQVSVRTVGRRLSAALARLEDSARRAGAQVSALALLGLALYYRWVGVVRSHRWPSTVAIAAAGTVSAVAVGVAVVSPSTPAATQGVMPLVVAPVHIALPSGQPLADATGLSITIPEAVKAAGSNSHAGGNAKNSATQGSIDSTRVCGGNPTDAPPPVPVGTRGPHAGPPVTTPPRGGCGHRS